MAQWVLDPVLLQLWLGPDPWPGNFQVLQCSQKEKRKSCHRGAAETNPTRNQEVAGSIPGLDQWVMDLVLP